MESQPRVEERGAQAYVGIRARVGSEAEFRAAVDRGFPELFGWVESNALTPSGPPLIRYIEVDREDQPVEFVLAAPVADPASGDGRVDADALPAGRYVTLLHVGPYTSAEVPDLRSARAELVAWVERQGLELAASSTDQGTVFQACVERYITDPREEPDWSKWETELAYLVKDR